LLSLSAAASCADGFDSGGASVFAALSGAFSEDWADACFFDAGLGFSFCCARIAVQRKTEKIIVTTGNSFFMFIPGNEV
jgi:hypothetical protein